MGGNYLLIFIKKFYFNTHLNISIPKMESKLKIQPNEYSLKLDLTEKNISDIHSKMLWLEKIRNQFLYAQRRVSLMIKQMNLNNPLLLQPSRESPVGFSLSQRSSDKLWFFQSVGLFIETDVSIAKTVIDTDLKRIKKNFEKLRTLRKDIIVTLQDKSTITKLY